MTEQNQRDESAVHDALTHVHIDQQRSLKCRTETASDKQDSSHCHSLRQTMVDYVEVALRLRKCFCGLSFNQYYNQAPQAQDSTSRIKRRVNMFIVSKQAEILNWTNLFLHSNSEERCRQKLCVYVVGVCQ